MINDILKHIRAWMDLPARYADGRRFLREPEVATEIIVPTACTAFIWTAVRETGNQTVMDEWSLWPYGSGRMESGPSFTDVSGAGSFLPTGRQRMTIR